MAGYLAFATGQVLTAAQVNGFLMEQATMTFADDAARTTALASVLREGLLTYNLDTNRLEVYDGTAWVEPAPEPPAGIGSNVVQTVKTDTFSTASGSYVEITGLTATITPTSDTSKVLVVAFASTSNSSTSGNTYLRVFRGSTGLSNDEHTSTRPSATNQIWAATISLLDSPGVDTAVTYSLRMRTTVGTGRLNVRGDGSDVTVISSLTVIEVAA